LRDEPENDYYRWGIGYCHLHLNVDKAASIPYFLKVLENPKANPSYYYDLGEAYLATNQFDKAEDAFKKFQTSQVKDEHELPVERMLEMLANAELAFKSPVNVEIINAGKEINTEFPEFSSFINFNEKFIVFASQSSTNAGVYRHEDGYYASDLYFSDFKFGHWTKRKRFSSLINTANIEIPVYLSANAVNLNIYSEDLLAKQKVQQIYTKKGKSYSQVIPILIDGVDMFYVKNLMISPDNQLLIFSMKSNRENANDLDLFYSERTPTGYWAKPQAFDSTINTIYDDSYPYFEPKAKKFYFATKGHNSIGGYDLMECEIEWSDSVVVGKPKNLGYPVNTTLDDKTISFNSNGRYAYISSLRENGFGDLDIYRVVFKDVMPLMTVVRGSVQNQDSLLFTTLIEQRNAHIDTLNFPINIEFKRLLLKQKDSVAAYTYLKKNKIPHEKLDISMKAINKKTGESAGQFIVKERNASFALILPPGEYRLVFKRNGFYDYFVDNLLIEDFDYRNQEIELYIKMRQITHN
jgi:hypothetical protein